jgi:hypothetical protein
MCMSHSLYILLHNRTFEVLLFSLFSRIIFIVLIISTFVFMPVQAAIYRWDNGELIPGTENITPGPNVDLSAVDLAYANLQGMDLTNVYFGSAPTTTTDFTNSIITGAGIDSPTINGFTFAQLQSTASYKNKYLAGIRLTGYINYLDGWDLSEQNLMNTKLYGSTQTTDFRLADLRGATNLGGAIYNSFNSIFPNGDGYTAGFSLADGNVLCIRDYKPYRQGDPIDMPINLESTLFMQDNSVLKMIFEDNQWGSKITMGTWMSKDGPIYMLPTFNGTLELNIASTFDPAQLIPSLTLDLFDWTGTLPDSSRFDSIVSIGLPDGFSWDTSDLYTTGEITLVPEPGTLILLLSAFAIALYARRLLSGD